MEEISKDNRLWLSSEIPRPEIVSVSTTVWGVKYLGAMVSAPTIDEAVSVMRACKLKPE